jgi:hypothetical protein
MMEREWKERVEREGKRGHPSFYQLEREDTHLFIDMPH